jgi:hypothetical protein
MGKLALNLGDSADSILSCARQDSVWKDNPKGSFADWNKHNTWEKQAAY